MNNDLSAAEAASILGVSLSTLYSYVSRGLLTAGAAQASRKKSYPRDEVLRLAARRADGKRGGHQATGAMNWGTPVLETYISRIADGMLYYRGRSALALADSATLEAVACLLWDDTGRDYFAEAAPVLPPGLLARARLLAQSMQPLEAAMAMLPVLARALPAQAGSAISSGAALMRLLAALLLDAEPSGLPLHRQVAAAWKADQAQSEVIRAVLVLLADHELNASTFTVRCVASTGADLAAALSAGLAALSGPQHGAGSILAREVLDAALASATPDEVLAAYFARHDPGLAGFSHPLYPAGDPRAAYLLELLSHLPSASDEVDAIHAVGMAAARLLDLPPNADFALAVLERVCAWPPGAGRMLFALARSAGWIAHAAEQAGSGAMIRPRSRYIGKFIAE